MKTFICFALFIAAAAASGIISPIGAPLPLGLAGISPLGLGIAPQPLVINSSPQLISSPLGLGLGSTKIISSGLPLNLGLGGLRLGSPLGLGLNGPLISSLNGGIVIGK